MLAKLKICLVGPAVLKRALQGLRLLLKKCPGLDLLLQALVDPNVPLPGQLLCKIYPVLVLPLQQSPPKILSGPLLGPMLPLKTYLVLGLLPQQSEEVPALSLHLHR
jgi:hypothetical protein